jgi:predicted transcriptional regulator
MDKTHQRVDIEQAGARLANIAAIWASIDRTKIGLREILLLNAGTRYKISGHKLLMFLAMQGQMQTRNSPLVHLAMSEISLWLIAFQEHISKNRITTKTRSLSLASALAKHPCVSVTDICKACNVSPDTARRWLQKLVAKGFATTVKLGNTDYFYLNDFLDMICRLAEFEMGQQSKVEASFTGARAEKSRSVMFERPPMAQTSYFRGGTRSLFSRQ